MVKLTGALLQLLIANAPKNTSYALRTQISIQSVYRRQNIDTQLVTVACAFLLEVNPIPSGVTSMCKQEDTRNG
jgi:hypothetical protein